jgi:parvulin-like peptidyl-prolyl isomerase
MTWKTSQSPKNILLIILSIFLFTACNGEEPTVTPGISAPEGTSTPIIEVSATPSDFVPPTTDPDIPLAASINGQGIWLEDYQAEVQRAQAASGTGLVTFNEDDVLQNLIDEMLLMQGAAEAGFIPDETAIQNHITQLGLSNQALQDWLTANQYTPESFERTLARSIAAAWMRDQISAGIPSTAEQVHARQILLYNADEAEQVYAQLQTGTDFATLATQYDPLAAGELGWFPRGYLTVSKLDDPIFALQAGEYTEIIETVLGFHIVQVIEREPQHPLSPGAYQALQVQTIQNWLTERRNLSNIQIMLP